MKKIKIGIIGCGHWGPNFVRNFVHMEEVDKVSICDLDIEKAMHIKDSYKQVKIYRDYRLLLADAKLDAVVVSTSASTHHKIVKDALLSNKHVLCEKPLSLNSRDTKELIELSRKRKKILMVGHTFIYNRSVNKIRDIIKGGELGRIYYIHSRRTNLGPLRRDVNAIWDLSPHDISILNYILQNRPLEVSACAERFLHHKLEDVGFIILRYPDNVLVHIHVSWLDPKKIREMTIIGERKMLVYDDTSTSEPIRIYDKRVMSKKYDKEYRTFKEFQLIIKDGEVQSPKLNLEEPLKLECRHFIDSIAKKKKPLTGGEEGLGVIKVLEAIDRSLVKNGRFMRIK